jgi:hypothetical protein
MRPQHGPKALDNEHPTTERNITEKKRAPSLKFHSILRLSATSFCHVVSIYISRYDRLKNNHTDTPALTHNRFLREVLFLKFYELWSNTILTFFSMYMGLEARQKHDYMSLTHHFSDQ